MDIDGQTLSLWCNGPMSTDNENTTAKIRLPESLHRELRMIAADRRESFSALAREILRDALPTYAPLPTVRKNTGDRLPPD